MKRTDGADEERRKLFRRMEWVFVFLPPILAVFIAIFGGLFLAVLVPVPNTNFWGRWALAVVAILVVPAVVYLLREWLLRRR